LAVFRKAGATKRLLRSTNVSIAPDESLGVLLGKDCLLLITSSRVGLPSRIQVISKTPVPFMLASVWRI
jgi:hypothetical protein